MDVGEYTFLKKIEKLPFVEKIWLYGSRARKDFRDRSDIDLAIECPHATFMDWQKILDIIEDADTLLKIDCVRLDELKENSPFKKNILQERLLLFQKTAPLEMDTASVSYLCEKRSDTFKLLSTRSKGDPMTEPRWKQNFDELGKALERLKEAVEAPVDEHYFVRDSTIQRFEFCIELFWKNFKNFLRREEREVLSPRDAVAQAYQMKWFDNEKLWMKMLHDRNFMSHNYEQDKAEEIYVRIQTYYPEMKATYEKLKTLLDDRV